MARNYIELVLIVVFIMMSQQIVSGNEETSGEDIIKMRKHEFSALCPYTDTCYTNASAKEENLDFGIKCCDACKCDHQCGLNCCPDMSVYLKNTEDLFESKKIQCVDAQYRPYSQAVENGQSFEMISKCPFTFKDYEIAAKCAREYHDVIFDGPLGLFLPVLDRHSGLIYKNSFCASCHYINSSYLSHGRLKYLCKNFSRNITYIRDFITIPDTENEDGCNLLFDIPEGTDRFPWISKICNRNIIDRCNVTGRWLFYNRNMEEACLSYKSIYDNTFRNVHCFLCNGFELNDVTKSCAEVLYFDHNGDETSFLTLLNWNKAKAKNAKGKDNQGSNSKCFRDNIFDPLKRDEWTLFCTQGMAEIDQMCLPPFNETPSTIMLAMNIILEPLNGVKRKDYYTLNDIIFTIYDKTKHKMTMLISKDAMIHNIKGSLHFKTDHEITNFDTSTAFKLQNLQNVKVHIQFLINYSENELLTTILDFALGFTNISNYSNIFKAKFNNFAHLDENERLSNDSCSNNLNWPLFQICVSQSNKENDFHFELLWSRQKLSFDSFRLIVLEPEPFCPRVALPKQVFVSCNISQSFSNLYTKDFLSKTLSENETHLFFCHEDYFKHLSTLQSEENNFQEKEGYYTSGKALAVLTIACLIVSIISLGFTLVVYAVYPVLRSLPGLINMALITSLIVFQLVSFVRTVANINISWLCTLIGIFTHFSFILSFAWMFVCTFHMFKVFVYIRNRSVDRNECRKFASYCIFTSSVAVSLVVITIVISVVRSDGEDTGYGGIICYLKDSTLILYLVALPIALVILFNIVMFCVVVYKIQIQKHPMLASSNPKERQNITVFAKLSTITGMTWIFGFIYTFTQIETFAFIFIILNAGQGLFIMLSFVCNRRVFDKICKQKLRRSTTRQATRTTDV